MISSYVLSCKTKVIYTNMYSYFDECETIEIRSQNIDGIFPCFFTSKKHTLRFKFGNRDWNVENRNSIVSLIE